MLAKLRPRLTYANVVATIALFLALSTGGAYATHLVVNGSDAVDESLTGADVRGKPGTSTTPSVNGSLSTHDISGQPANAANGSPFVQGSLTTWDIADGTVRSADVLDNALKGADIDESSLGQVPVATLGGLGRSAASTDNCNPESSTYVRCVQVQLNLSRPARVLLNGRVTAMDEAVNNVDTDGSCRWGGVQESGPVEVSVEAGRDEDMSLVGLTNVLPAGQGYTFAIECREVPFHVSGSQYRDAWITAVAISPN
jgi:hypothetical protein